MRHDASEVARMLAGRVLALVAELLPAGHREGHEWVHASLTGTSRRSLSVHLTGNKAGVWCDFSSGETGDALDLVRTVRFGGDMRAAIEWARAWLGLSGTAPEHAQAPQPREAATPMPDAEQAKRRAQALAVFLSASEGLTGTPAAAYLAGRGIDLAELGRAPRALRFHPAVWCQEVGAKLPAMLAAITSGTGEHVATHRTWIVRTRDGTWTKAPLHDPKKTLGAYAGGYIPLQRGASKKPMREAPAGETVAIAEGIETALSVAVACPDLRTLAAVSLANMARIILPASVRTVILCADNDRPDNFAVDHALVAAIGHFAGETRRVRLARSPVGKDFNDAIRAA